MFNMQPGPIILLAVCASTVLCGVHPDGVSQVSRSQDALGNYQFGYTVSNAEGEHFRKEGTDALGRVIGSYGLTHADGRHRIVDYVADKDGFRASVRSNEPGVENSNAPASIIERTDRGLDTAATSLDDDQEEEEAYGKRLNPTSSRVAYVESDLDEPPPRRTRPLNQQDYRPEGASRNARQRNLQGYPPVPVARPPSPSDYRPAVVALPLNPTDYRQDGGPGISRIRPPSAASSDARPPNAYYPPIDPHTAIRRPAYYLPRNTDSNNYPTTTSRRPFIPPYGGFEDEPLNVNRYPGVSMSTIHGGLEPSTYLPPPSPTRVYGAGRYPSDDSPPRDFGPARYPGSEDNYALSRYPGGVPLPPGGSPDHSFGRPPPGSGTVSSPDLVLRAVPIPNGIQAVRLDPTTGRVYERLDYPMYFRNEGYPTYDRNVLIHNDDVRDDGREEPNNYDIPLRRRPSYRGARNQPFDEDDYTPDRRQYNRSYAPDSDEDRLSKPSARDMALIDRHLAVLNRNRYSPGQSSFPNGLPYGLSENSRYPDFDDEFDDSDVVSHRGEGYRNDIREFNPYAGAMPESHLFEHPGEFPFSRYPRNNRNRRLSPKDSKESVVSKLESSVSYSNETETKDKGSELEKE